MDREKEIKLIAYRMWEEEGCCHGLDQKHWLHAEMIWQEQQLAKPSQAETVEKIKPVLKADKPNKTAKAKGKKS